DVERLNRKREAQRGWNTAKSPEKDIQDAILDYLNLVVGVHAWRRNVGATISQYKGKKRLIRFNTKGMSDIWFIGPHGIHGECEVKQPGESLTEAQWLFQTEVTR